MQRMFAIVREDVDDDLGRIACVIVGKNALGNPFRAIAAASEALAPHHHLHDLFLYCVMHDYKTALELARLYGFTAVANILIKDTDVWLS